MLFRSYALHVIKGRWPEAEPVIQQDAEYAYLYALNVIEGRWPEAESTIVKSKREHDYVSVFFQEPATRKDGYTDFEWERAGCAGCFAPTRLLEPKEKNSIIDTMLDNAQITVP